MVFGDKMYDLFNENNSIWIHLRPGSHGAVARAIEQLAEVRRAFFECESREAFDIDLRKLTEPICLYTSRCIGQLAVAEFFQVPLCSLGLEPMQEGSDVLRFLDHNPIAEIQVQLAADDHLRELLMDMHEGLRLTRALIPEREEQASVAELAGIVRTVTRMVGCCIGQAMTAQRIGVLQVVGRLSDGGGLFLNNNREGSACQGLITGNRFSLNTLDGT